MRFAPPSKERLVLFLWVEGQILRFGPLVAKKEPRYRLTLGLMWTTGARISEVLAVTPASFVDNAPYGFVQLSIAIRILQ